MPRTPVKATEGERALAMGGEPSHATFRHDLRRIVGKEKPSEEDFRRLGRIVVQARRYAERSKPNSMDELRAIEDGKQARNLLAVHAMRAVLPIAANFHEAHGGYSGFTINDFVQSGAIGALQASTNYNPERYLGKFSTFASPRIRGAMYDELRLHGGEIRIPRSAYRFARRNLVTADLQRELGREPTHQEVARSVRQRQDEVFHSFLPLDEPFFIEDESGNGKFVSLGETLESRVPRQDVLHLRARLGQRLRVDLSHLTSQEQQVVQCIYYGGLTQEQTGKAMGLSESRVNQIKQKAIGKLRLSGQLLELIGHALFGEGAP